LGFGWKLFLCIVSLPGDWVYGVIYLLKLLFWGLWVILRRFKDGLRDWEGIYLKYWFEGIVGD
jgi:hypothetical protein